VPFGAGAHEVHLRGARGGEGATTGRGTGRTGEGVRGDGAAGGRAGVSATRCCASGGHLLGPGGGSCGASGLHSVPFGATHSDHLSGGLVGSSGPVVSPIRCCGARVTSVRLRSVRSPTVRVQSHSVLRVMPITSRRRSDRACGAAFSVGSVPFGARCHGFHLPTGYARLPAKTRRGAAQWDNTGAVLGSGAAGDTRTRSTPPLGRGWLRRSRRDVKCVRPISLGVHPFGGVSAVKRNSPSTHAKKLRPKRTELVSERLMAAFSARLATESLS
jgi:hypothetical protein